MALVWVVPRCCGYNGLDFETTLRSRAGNHTCSVRSFGGLNMLRTDGSDGGPAFPRQDDITYSAELGMSLRDAAAFVALPPLLAGLIGKPERETVGFSKAERAAAVADAAYEVADAMLVAREK